MAEIRQHLKNAPLKEAIIDLRASVPDDFNSERLLELVELLRDDYPKMRTQRIMQAEFKLPSGKSDTTQLGTGVWLTSGDGKQIAQFRTDGFTVNRLRPYTSWRELFPEALKLWEHYVNVTNVDHVSRVAVRYINRIDLPLRVDFDDYFTAPPKIPEGLPQTLGAFLTRIVMVDEDTNTLANVTQSLERGLDEKSVSVILDIDTYRQGQFSSDVAELTPIFEELHAFKNRIFFGFITEQTAQKYE